MARGYGHWAELKLYVVKGQVHFRHPRTGDIEGVWDGQFAMRWFRLSEQIFRVDKWISAGVRLPSGLAVR